MNMISKLRHRIYGCTAATITAEEYDQLQAEWITRAGAEDMVLAEREACASLSDDLSDYSGTFIAERILERSNK